MRFWDRIARLSGNRSGALGATARRTIEASRPYLEPGHRVLDHGCGGGALTCAIAERVGSVDGVDPSPLMLEAAREAAARRGIANVRFMEIDALAADGPGPYDVVTVFNVLPYVEDLDRTMADLADRLIPGGALITATACVGERWSLIRVVVALASAIRLLPGVSALRARDVEDAARRSGLTAMAKVELSSMPEYLIVFIRS